MHILVTGLNHRTASVEVREQFSIAEDELHDMLIALKQTKSVLECVIVSTCNRTEIYTVVDRLHLRGHYIKNFIEQRFRMKRSQFLPHLYTYENQQAVEHLFRVASGLDSMIVGETQILGQVRDAFLQAQQMGTTKTLLNTLFQRALAMAKRAHSETMISENAVSISYAAVELSKQIFGSLANQTVLIIGAGKTGELTAKHILTHGAKRIIVANRTVETAKRLSQQFGGQYCSMAELGAKLAEADIVISSTGAPGIVLTREQVKQAIQLRKTKDTLLLIDIAVPRDLDPEISLLDDVLLRDIDDLEGLVQSNLEQRREQAQLIEEIVAAEVESFENWHKTLGVGPVIRALHEKSTGIHEGVMQSIMNKLPDLSEREMNIIRKLSRSIVNQMLQDPIAKLKEMTAETNNDDALRMFSELFNLEQQLELETEKNTKVEMLFSSVNYRNKAVQDEKVANTSSRRELTARS